MKPRFSGSKQRPFRLALHSIHPTLHARSVSSSILRTQMSQTLQKDSASPRLCLSDLDLFHTLDSHSLDSQEPQSLCNVSVCEGDRQRQREREREISPTAKMAAEPPHVNNITTILMRLFYCIYVKRHRGKKISHSSNAPRTAGGPSRPRGLNNPSCPGEEERHMP